MKKIDSKNISVVIQGLVVGNNETDSNKRFTERCINSVRKYLPKSQIILSTWERCDASGLDYDILIKSEEPEDIYMVWNNGEKKLMTVNNQIISTNKGLDVAVNKYTLKIRSDIVLEGVNFIKYFEKYNRNNDSELLKKRVLTLPTYNPRKVAKFLFDPSDWFFFGLTTDIKNIFDIPVMDKNKLKGEKINGYYLIENNLEAEQYIWTNFLSKYHKIHLPYGNYFSEESLVLSENSYAKNLIMLPANKIKMKCLKMPRAGYGATPWLSQGLYTFSDYKEIYNKYNEKKIFFVHNFVENIIYWFTLNSRLFFKKRTPLCYKKIVNFVRKVNGSYNFLK